MGKLSSRRLRFSETVALIRSELHSTLSTKPGAVKSTSSATGPFERIALGDWFSEGGR